MNENDARDTISIESSERKAWTKPTIEDAGVHSETAKTNPLGEDPVNSKTGS